MMIENMSFYRISSKFKESFIIIIISLTSNQSSKKFLHRIDKHLLQIVLFDSSFVRVKLICIAE